MHKLLGLPRNVKRNRRQFIDLALSGRSLQPAATLIQRLDDRGSACPESWIATLMNQVFCRRDNVGHDVRDGGNVCLHAGQTIVGANTRYQRLDGLD